MRIDYQTRLDEAYSASKTSAGASFAYWDGKDMHRAVAGVRNVVTGDPITTDTVMHIGSVTKVLNAALFMQLVDDGLVHLDDPVLKHLPDLRLADQRALEKMTCLMLLNHTSGINCEWLRDRGPDQERIVDAIARCADLDQLHEPGSGPAYNNMGPVIAGHIVQTKREKSWYDVIAERLFSPLGLQNAVAYFADLPLYRSSVGHQTDYATGREVRVKRPFFSPSFAPSGSTVMMSAADLTAVAVALVNGGVGLNGARILSASSSALMMTPTATCILPQNSSWGVGWHILPSGLLAHSGGAPGGFAQLYARASQGRAAALLLNHDKYGAFQEQLLDPLTTDWTGTPPAGLAARIDDYVDPAPYIGVFENNGEHRIEVTAAEGGLEVRISTGASLQDTADIASEQPPVSLAPLGGDSFEWINSISGHQNAEVRFAYPDAAGRMQYLVAGARMLRRTA